MIIDCLAHLAQPMPAWLADLTPDGIQAGPIVWRWELLESALVYPGSGDDASPIRQCSGIVRSFIFFDLSVSRDSFLAAMTKRRGQDQGFKHHRLVGLTEFDATEFLGSGRYLAADPLAPLGAVDAGFGLWGVYETTVRGPLERFSLLILHVDAIVGLTALYDLNPPFALVAQDHGFSNIGRPSLGAAVHRHAEKWTSMPRLLIAGRSNHLAELIARGRLLGEDVATESAHRNVREFYELPPGHDHLLHDWTEQPEPEDSFLELASWALTHSSTRANEVRAMLVELNARPVGDHLEPRIIVAYDHLILTNEVDATVLDAWPALVEARVQPMAEARATSPTEDNSPPALQAWQRNRAAARAVLLSPKWQDRSDSFTYLRLQEIARRHSDDAWSEILGNGNEPIADAQIAEWAAADTPERRWAFWRSGHHDASDGTQSAAAHPALSETERIALMGQPHSGACRQRHCPKCGSEFGERWFLVAHDASEAGPSRSTHTWVAVCMPCRVRVGTVLAGRVRRME